MFILRSVYVVKGGKIKYTIKPYRTNNPWVDTIVLGVPFEYTAAATVASGFWCTV